MLSLIGEVSVDLILAVLMLQIKLLERQNTVKEVEQIHRIHVIRMVPIRVAVLEYHLAPRAITVNRKDILLEAERTC